VSEHFKLDSKHVFQLLLIRTCNKPKFKGSQVNYYILIYSHYSHKYRSLQNGTYKLESKTSPEYQVYCVMNGTGCGHGGWTLVMKMDGNKVMIMSKPKTTFL
jgi:hypothetical protein